ncbi:Inner membrane protein YbaN [Marinomonas spartinae]|uniref:Inner membrane protein n=1 Tax=Marinomonas spartinae TaxID=1792290 RepID=A0A1A8TQL6_9GAMM|nr:YbaN family protein [Marinomonas spartinae]SBS36674.1 Inner membrane protein YbaN [Marinomonas spartinae]SBS38725.1 Inner membrane protein YbaN [Marinomonas spartinae]
MQGKRIGLLILGWLSLITGIIGIFLPLLPTTPLVLLAAWCFSKSSERFHHWLMNHKHFGPMIHDWQSGKGIPRKARNRAIILMWIGMGISMILIGRLWAAISLICIGLAVCTYLLRLPVRPEKPDDTSI